MTILHWWKHKNKVKDMFEAANNNLAKRTDYMLTILRRLLHNELPNYNNFGLIISNNAILVIETNEYHIDDLIVEEYEQHKDLFGDALLEKFFLDESTKENLWQIMNSKLMGHTA